MGQHELQRLNPRHFAIVDLVLAGHATKDIAMALSMTPQAISLITNSPNFQHEVSRRREVINRQTDSELALIPAQAKSLMESKSLAAAQVHVDLLDVKNDPKVRQASANAILDRVYGDPSKQQSKVMILNVEAINLLQIALSESKRSVPALGASVA